MFEEFLGNDELKEEISALLESDSFPHAVFFSGEEGTGCDFFARLVAAEYLRDHSSLVMRNVHPDFVSVQGSGSSGQVSVSDVREALYEMNKAAVMTDGRRVLHIRQAENLNAYSANALLKMMEEPPEGVVFILTVRRQDDLMPTIRSRAVGYRISYDPSPSGYKVPSSAVLAGFTSDNTSFDSVDGVPGRSYSADLFLPFIPSTGSKTQLGRYGTCRFSATTSRTLLDIYPDYVYGLTSEAYSGNYVIRSVQE
ncbi:MAG: hypothetical protein II047_10900 [Bacteroidales bacterium]|nr:hypothetical protein [Bacteroidales bacterium]